MPDLLLGFQTEKFLKYAEEQMPDLIIIGAKGLGGTASILVGGEVQQVVEYAACLVLVERTPDNGLRGVILVTVGSGGRRQPQQGFIHDRVDDRLIREARIFGCSDEARTVRVEARVGIGFEHAGRPVVQAKIDACVVPAAEHLANPHGQRLDPSLKLGIKECQVAKLHVLTGR
jgi:hypothetical protein